MAQVTVDNTTELARYEFNGSTLPTDWNIVQQGSGQTVSVASSVLTIAAGTTASAATTIRCTIPFRIKSYARFVLQLSQRIANQNVYLEVTNNAGTTYARYDFNGTTATSVQCVTVNNSTANTAVTVTCPTTATYGTFDIYADTYDVIFSSVASNSNAIKSGVAAFDRLILDPDEDYFIQVRVVNGGTAPASNTNVQIDSVALQDLTGLKVDIIRGDGTASLASAAPVQVMSSATVPASQSGTWTVQPGNTANTTPWLVTSRSNIFYNESTTALAASATFTGTSRDVGLAAATVQPYAAFNVSAFADQAGTLRIEMSNDNTTWRRATADTAVAANAVGILSVPVVTRYYRAVYVNGATLQGAFMINSSFTAA
jgi:hypothetical protein